MSQRLFAIMLIVLTALGFYVLWKDLQHRPAGKSRIDWPVAPAAKP